MQSRSFTLVGLFAYLLAPGAQAQQAPPEVIVAPARIEAIADRIEALGTLRANESVILTATVTDTVTAIHFEDGDRVEKGAVLLEMTSGEEHAQLEEARSTVEEARAQYERVIALAQQQNVSESLVDQRRREWETARARLEAIASRLEDRVIRAPFSGVVGLRDLSPGALVQPGDVITTLDDDSVMKLEFSVPSTFLDVLRPGLPVEARAKAYDRRVFTGTVSAVDSRVDPVTRSVLVRALVPNPDRVLKPGMLMRVELLKNPREAVVVPESALLPRGEEQFVMVVHRDEGNTVERRPVTIGLRKPGVVEIPSGLEAGELVVTHGVEKVRPGYPAEIRAVDDGSLTIPEIIDAGFARQDGT